MSLLGLALETAAVWGLTLLPWKLAPIDWTALSAIATFVLAGVAVWPTFSERRRRREIADCAEAMMNASVRDLMSFCSDAQRRNAAELKQRYRKLISDLDQALRSPAAMELDVRVYEAYLSFLNDLRLDESDKVLPVNDPEAVHFCDALHPKGRALQATLGRIPGWTVRSPESRKWIDPKARSWGAL